MATNLDRAFRRRRAPRVAAALAALALAPAAALGTTTEEVDATCPVCGAEFKAFVILSTNTFGGQDRDFFSRARGEQPVEIVIWTCPSCSFSGFKDDFEKAVSGDLKKAFSRSLASLRAEWKDEKDPLPSWRRYELAGRVAELRGDAAETRGWLALRAAWCVRLGMGLPTAAESAAWSADSAAFGRALDELYKGAEPKAAAAAGTKNPAEIEVAMAEGLAREFEAAPPAGGEAAWRALAIAVLFRLRGEHEGTLRWLDRVEAKDSGAPAGARAHASAVRRGVALEREYQARAVKAFEEFHEKGPVPEKNLPGLRFLIGETHRRLGNREKAGEWIRKSLETPGVNDYLKDGSRRSLAALGAGGDAGKGEPTKKE
jgi:rubredoxin